MKINYALTPRDTYFLEGKCIAVGFRYNIKHDKKEVIKFPTDHYDFIGPVKYIGLTKEEIEENIRMFMEHDG